MYRIGHSIDIHRLVKDRKLILGGIEIPFEIELSIKLKLYGLIDSLIPNVEELVDTLWQ